MIRRNYDFFRFQNIFQAPELSTDLDCWSGKDIIHEAVYGILRTDYDEADAVRSVRPKGENTYKFFRLFLEKDVKYRCFS
jgi:hypothetical protein